jgi:hypothetical protein
MSDYLELLPIALLAVAAIAVAILLRRIRVPWFVGGPVAGFVAAVCFVLIASALAREPEPFIYVALFFSTLYGTAFALLAYLVLALLKRRGDSTHPSQ